MMSTTRIRSADAHNLARFLVRVRLLLIAERGAENNKEKRKGSYQQGKRTANFFINTKPATKPDFSAIEFYFPFQLLEYVWFSSQPVFFTSSACSDREKQKLEEIEASAINL